LSRKEVRHGNRYSPRDLGEPRTAIFLALFARLATRVVAKYGFDHPDDT
jgi:hypothetical protein